MHINPGFPERLHRGNPPSLFGGIKGDESNSKACRQILRRIREPTMNTPEINHPVVVNHLNQEVAVRVLGLQRFDNVYRVEPTANRALSVDQLPSPAPGVWHVIEHASMDMAARTDLVELHKLYSCNTSRTAFGVSLPGSPDPKPALLRPGTVFEVTDRGVVPLPNHEVLAARAMHDTKRDAKVPNYWYQHRVQVPKEDKEAIERRAAADFVAIWATASVVFFAIVSILNSLFG